MYTSTETSTETSTATEDRNSWVWGFTPQAEIWNGRIAMLGFIAALLTELFSGNSILHFWNVM